MPKLTKRIVDATAPKPTGDVFVWCSILRGFGLRTKSSGVKTYLIQYRNSHGRSRRLAIGQHGRLTTEEARDEARQALAAVERGADPAATKAAARTAVTVKELCRDYLDHAEKGLLLTRSGKPKKPSTLYVDRGRIMRHIVPLLGHRIVRDISTADIRAFARDVIGGKTATIERTKKRGKAVVEGGPGTAARTLGLLGGIFTYAVQEGIRLDNPVRGIVKPAVGKRSIYMDRDQYQALGKALSTAEAAGEPWQAIEAIRLLALTGCRRGEIEWLRWSDIDDAGRCLRLGDTKTGASVRPLSTAAAECLHAIRSRSKGPFVFPAIRRDSGAFSGLPKAWQRIVKEPELASLTPHGLRHAFAATAEDLGMSLPTIASLLGHRLAGVTAGYVTKPDATLVAAADRVARFIEQAMSSLPSTIVSHPAAIRDRRSAI